MKLYSSAWRRDQFARRQQVFLREIDEAAQQAHAAKKHDNADGWARNILRIVDAYLEIEKLRVELFGGAPAKPSPLPPADPGKPKTGPCMKVGCGRPGWLYRLLMDGATDPRFAKGTLHYICDGCAVLALQPHSNGELQWEPAY